MENLVHNSTKIHFFRSLLIGIIFISISFQGQSQVRGCWGDPDQMNYQKAGGCGIHRQ